jgi:ferredoxin
MDEDNKAECYNPEGSSVDDIQASAIDACPVSCIHWKDE